MDAPPHLVFVIGASVRFACQSLRQAGWNCAGADLFADLESGWAGEVHQVSDYPLALFDAVRKANPPFWMYTGGLENYGRLFASAPELNAATLLGNDAACLQRVRDPFLLKTELRRFQFDSPAVHKQLSPSQFESAKWLSKSSSSCGGLGVRFANRNSFDDVNSKLTSANPTAGCVDDECRYFQEFAPGSVWGATFLAGRDDCQLLGACKALSNKEQAWTGAPQPFQYSGSIGPMPLTASDNESLQQLGRSLTTSFGLQGIFGVDLIRSESQCLARWLVLEVNPRLPSSSELLERAYGISMAGAHAQTCMTGELPELLKTWSDSLRRKPPSLEHRSVGDVSAETLYGKAIVYANEPTRSATPLRRLAFSQKAKGEPSWFADTPSTDDPIRVQSPIATVFAQGDSEAEVLAELRINAARMRSLCQGNQ